MAVESADAEMAMLAGVDEWPMARAVMAPRCEKRVWSGVRWEEGVEKERSEGRDQTWMFESAEPERRKDDVGSMARDVTGWRWDWGVVIWRPVHI